MARPPQRQLGDHIETGAVRASYRVWEQAHGGRAPRSLRTLYGWASAGKFTLPSEDANVTSYFDFPSGRKTHTHSVVARLDALAASERPGRPPKTGTVDVSCPSPSPQTGVAIATATTIPPASELAALFGVPPSLADD